MGFMQRRPMLLQLYCKSMNLHIPPFFFPCVFVCVCFYFLHISSLFFPSSLTVFLFFLRFYIFLSPTKSFFSPLVFFILRCGKDSHAQLQKKHQIAYILAEEKVKKKCKSVISVLKSVASGHLSAVFSSGILSHITH